MMEVPGKKGLKYIPQSSWPNGFHKDLTYAQALEIQRSYNDSEVIKREASAQAIKARLKTAERFESAYLPEDVKAAYHATYLSHLEGKALSNAQSLWKEVQRVVVAINMPPERWCLNPQVVYKALADLGKSPDWCKRVFAALNLYGALYGLERKGFVGVKKLPNTWHVKIADAFHDAEKGEKSGKLTLEALEELKKKLSPEHWRWVNASFWFGLRPEEVDLLLGPPVIERRDMWKVENEALTIYQPKLRGLRWPDRYKHIPFSCPEQPAALSLLKQGAKRPGPRVLEHFPQGVRLYGGRHGFTSYWDAKGVDIRTISRWLGHRYLMTTEKYYRDLGLVHKAGGG